MEDLNKAAVPLYASAGWLEGGNAQAAVSRFLNYTSPDKKLILGPWDHNFFNISPFTRPGLTHFRIDQEMLKFFDDHLKGISLADHKDKAVHYYTLGEERWHASDTWPPASKPMMCFLGSNHELIAKSEQTKGSDLYEVNPNAGSGKSGRWDCMLGNPLLQPYPDRKKQINCCSIMTVRD